MDDLHSVCLSISKIKTFIYRLVKNKGKKKTSKQIQIAILKSGKQNGHRKEMAQF